jgi:biotin synthase-related radical SAM superfamily protein
MDPTKAISEARSRVVLPNVRKIRVSVGTAGALSLLRLHSDAEPTTAYLMTYTPDSCSANCGFCPQASGSSSTKDKLSRVIWPDFDLDVFMEKAIPSIREGKFQRICIQAINYSGFTEDVMQISSSILSKERIPISISCPPTKKTDMERLRQVGVERIGIPLDGATPEIFEKVKGSLANGPYRWDSHFAALKDALAVFGRKKVATHLIVGLGETERELVEVITRLIQMGVNPSLFAFTPIKGTRLEGIRRPEIGSYRRVQLAMYLIMQKLSSPQLMRFDDEEKITDFGARPGALQQAVSLGHPFKTFGCPGCNRPFYTENPRGPIYNYPRDLSEEEALKAIEEMKMEDYSQGVSK